MSCGLHAAGNGSRLAVSQDGETPPQLVKASFARGLGSLSTGAQAKLLRTIQSGSRVAAASLNSFMPEQHEGQNMYISECLSGLRGDRIIVESLKVALFLISNNFTTGQLVQSRWSDTPTNYGSKVRSASLQPGDHEEEQIKADKMIMAVLDMSGFNNIPSLKQLISAPGATARAIAQQLFASSVRTHNLKSLWMLLTAGMSSQTSVFRNHYPCSPLIIAAEIQHPSVALEMARLLLSHNASTIEPQALEYALFHAIRFKNRKLVRLLLLRGAYIAGESLEAAIKAKNFSLLQMLLDVDPDVNKEVRDEEFSHSTILGIAVGRNDIPLTRKLLALGAEVDALQSSTSEYFYNEVSNTTTLGIAVENGNNELVNLLIQAGANVNHEAATDDCRYVPPLVLAVLSGCKEITKRLLEAGADISVAEETRGGSLIGLALEKQDLEMCRILLANGASVDGDSTDDYTRLLYYEVVYGQIDTVDFLLSWSARVNVTYDKVPETILGAAISCGDCAKIRILLQEGATNTGRLLIEIGSLKAAIYLDQLDILSDILLRCGQPILVSAIAKESCGRGDGLLQYLLDLGVDRQRGTVGCLPFELEEDFYWPYLSVVTSPLAKAITCRNVTLAEILVERGAPVTDLELCEAVDWYLYMGNYKFLSLLLPKLARHPCEVPNSFVKALKSDNTVFLVQRFLDIGLDPQGKVVSNGSLHNIYLYQLHGTIKCRLIASALEVAAEWMRCPNFKTLLRATTWTAVEKGRALTISISFRNKRLVRDLLDAQADVNQELIDYGGEFIYDRGPATPLLLAVRNKDVSLIKCLINAGADIQDPNIVISAVSTGNEQIVKNILEAGANVNHPASSHRGRTALQLATEKGDIELVDILLEAGADVNQEPAERAGATALQFAAIRGYIGIAHRLLDSGADVNAAKSLSYGRTTLEGAAEYGRIDMLQLLLNKGASIRGRGRRQYIRAVKLAEKNIEYAATQLLREHGGWNEADAQQYEIEAFDMREKENREEEEKRMPE